MGLGAGFRPDDATLDGLTAMLGCRSKVIRGKVYYGLGLPRPAWMEDQVQFEQIIAEIKVIDARLQLYGPLSPVSFDGWDDVGSSNSLGSMADRPFEQATS